MECIKCKECGHRKVKMLCPFWKLCRKYPYVAYVNVVLLLMIVATSICGVITSFHFQNTIPVNMTEESSNRTEQSLPSDINFDIQLTNECAYGKTVSEKSTKTNPYTGK